MSDAFEKIKKQLEEACFPITDLKKVNWCYGTQATDNAILYERAIEIIQEIAEEYQNVENGFVSKIAVLKLIEDIKCDRNIPKNYGTLLDILQQVRSLPTVMDNKTEIPEELKQYQAIGTVKGYEEAIKASLEYYNLMKEYESKLQVYEAIGTPEECELAMKRMKPKDVIVEKWSPAYCPACDEELSELIGDGYYKHYTYLDYCPNCGQILNWTKGE